MERKDILKGILYENLEKNLKKTHDNSRMTGSSGIRMKLKLPMKI